MPTSTIGNPRSLLKFEYSREELLALMIVPAGQFALVLGYTILASDPQRVQFLYSAIPEELQTIPGFLVFLIAEFCLVGTQTVAYCLSLVTQLLFFQKLELEFLHINRQLK